MFRVLALCLSVLTNQSTGQGNLGLSTELIMQIFYL